MIPIWLIVVLTLLGIACVAIPLHIAMTGVCFLCLAAVLLVLRQFAKHGYRGIWKKIIIALTVAAATVILGCTCIVIAEGQNETLPEEQPGTVIVLGAQIHGDHPSRTLKERLELAREYLLQNADAVCIVSGGQGSDESFPESYVMAKWLTEHGIAENRIFRESQSHTTRENLVLSQQIAAENGIEADSVLLITSEFHLLRAKYLAKRLEMKAYGLGSRTTPGILMVNYALREVFSMVKAVWQTARA